MLTLIQAPLPYKLPSSAPADSVAACEAQLGNAAGILLSSPATGVAQMVPVLAVAPTQILTQLVGPSQAAQALLRCHTLRVRAAQQQLLKHHSTGGAWCRARPRPAVCPAARRPSRQRRNPRPCLSPMSALYNLPFPGRDPPISLLSQLSHPAAGGDPDGVEYAGSLAQRTFLDIATAVDDVRAVFPASAAPAASSLSTPAAGGLDSSGGPLPSVSALLVAWAGEEAAECSALLCDHSLRPFAATGGAVDALIAVGGEGMGEGARWDGVRGRENEG